MSANLKISSYSTEADLYDALSRVFGQTISSDGGTRWVSFTHDGVDLTFFAPKETTVEA